MGVGVGGAGWGPGAGFFLRAPWRCTKAVYKGGVQVRCTRAVYKGGVQRRFTEAVYRGGLQRRCTKAEYDQQKGAPFGDFACELS